MRNSRDKFDNAWKDAFEGSVSPPRNEVWTGIDSALSRQQVGSIKRKLMIYKLLAAASVVFAIGIGFLSLFNIDQSGMDQKSQMADNERSTGEINESRVILRDDIPYEGRINIAETPDRTFPASNEENQTNLTINSNKSVLAVSSETDSRTPGNSEVPEIIDESLSSRIRPLSSSGLSFQPPLNNSVPQKVKNPFDEPWIEFYEQEEEKESDPVLWAGLNLSSGVFDPRISYGNRSSSFMDQLASIGLATDNAEPAPSADFNSLETNRATFPEKSEYRPEFSYAYGLNMGYSISRRLTLLGGLAYMYSNSSTTTNSYIENTRTDQKVAYQMLNASQVDRSGLNAYNVSSEDITLNNSYEFLSVPVRLGYTVVDRKIEWILLGGFSADFLLQNEIYDNSGYLETTKISTGESSPYHVSYLNGSLGTMVNYALSDNYRISLEPSYRLGLSYLTKEEADFNSRPTAFFISAGISYIFK